MFRIKTDIRQYKCESREKVERLIRNWVIRPTDLIFDEDEQEWGPIGEHSAFVSTFAELAKRESEAEDTLVSEEAPPEKPPVARREDDPPDPPEPPEGVEPESASPDEITLMTEETLESILDEGEAPSRKDGGIETVETGAADGNSVGEQESGELEVDEPEETQPEETQPEAPRPSFDSGDARPEETDGAEQTDPEATSIDGREFTAEPATAAESEDEEQTDPEAASIDERPIDDQSPGSEATDPDATRPEEFSEDSNTAGRAGGRQEPDDDLLRDTDELGDEESVTRTPSGRHDAVDPAGTLADGDEEDSVGRHDLPEEIFATNEISESDGGESVGPGDELENGRTAHEANTGGADYADVEEALQKNAREARRQKQVDDEWDEILDRLRETDELSKEEIEEITKTRDQIAIGRDDGDDEVDDEEVPEEIEEYVSEGYGKQLPVEVGPSRRDVQLGLRHSEATEEEKDRVFPYPGPKREGEVEQHVYQLRASTDHSLKVILGVLGAVVVLIGVAVLFF
jgi:hypothetical protein